TLFFEVTDRHVCTFAREVQRDGTPDAAVATGNHGHLAVEPPAAPVAWPDALWRGCHLRLPAGLMVLLLRRLPAIACTLHGRGTPVCRGWGTPPLHAARANRVVEKFAFG